MKSIPYLLVMQRMKVGGSSPFISSSSSPAAPLSLAFFAGGPFWLGLSLALRGGPCWLTFLRGESSMTIAVLASVGWKGGTEGQHCE